MHKQWTTRVGRASTPLAPLAAALASPPAVPDERYFHEDLPGLSDAALSLECERLRLALLALAEPSSWLLQRLALIEAELQARRG